MKINPVNMLIVVLLGAVITYGLWSLGGELRNYVAVGGFIFLTGTLLPLFLDRYENARGGLNLRVVSGGFFVIAMGLNGLFALVDFSATAYIVISAILFLIYMLLANSIYNAKQ